MVISEEVRHKIHEAFRASHGDEVANGLMELLPPVGWADVATRHDLLAVEERVDARFSSLEERMGLRFELVETRLGERLERALKEQATRYVGWLIAVAAVSITGASVLNRLG